MFFFSSEVRRGWASSTASGGTALGRGWARVPRRLQAFALLTNDDEAYLVLAIDTAIDRYITAATVSGKRVPSLANPPKELEWARRVIVADSIKLLEPVPVAPTQVNAEAARYAFKRVVMNTTYLFSSARVKAQAATTQVGFGLATEESVFSDYLDAVGAFLRGRCLTLPACPHCEPLLQIF